jgi:hypothetical protein
MPVKPLIRPARAGVQALRVTSLADLHGRIDEDLDERQVGLVVSLAEIFPVGRERRDQRHHCDRSRVRHQARHLADAADVLGPVARAETEVL